MSEEPSLGIPTEHMTLTRSGVVIPPLSMPIPPGTTIDDLRVRLYTLIKPIRFTGADFARYWPYLTNLWTRQYKGSIDEHGVRLELWHCKNSHATIRPPAVRERKGEGIRNRPLKEIPTNCGMKMRLVFFYGDDREEDDLAHWVLMSNDHKGTGVHEHHTLDDLDRAKRCKKFMDICYRKTQQGYSAPAIARWFQRAYAGQHWCKYIGRMDVKNAGQLWRAKHRDVVMKTEVEDDEPMPDGVEGPTWMESVIDEASHHQIRDAMKTVCKELPAAQDKLLPILMRWESEERSPSPTEEVHGSVFQDPEGNIRIVQPRPRRDLLQRAPSMVFKDPPVELPAFIPQNQVWPPARPLEGLTVYPPQDQPWSITQHTGPSSVSVQGPRSFQQPPTAVEPTSNRSVFGPQAQPQTPQNAGRGTPGRPPNQSRVYTSELRPLQPAPPKANEGLPRTVVHVNSVNPSVVAWQSPPPGNVIGEQTKALFTSRPRWAN